MNSPVEFNALDTETLDTEVLDILSADPVWKHLATSMLCTEDEKLMKDDICLSNMLPHRKSYLSFHDLDYAEKIKKLQCFLDSVKKIASPGCSQEVLNVALSLMSTLVRILSAMSLEQYPRASL
ncbi:pyrophosphate--fructose 6-phosphate 1-phosphotransferase subunit alpha-like [Olea europaea subsp. europaea]|uniref:Pyrophosphate--fructose 6-phosphate 1-phosphotransferase subunit alpha-like n=2 Tax=Olea europaea subsp. europaea TaxID=158383 RepID=A0A8S0P8H9_OLEEU|nr:pyrophosphate--fructose 6-phosphate 1-phosphotransferase subunit alpha-like [Olea europaea subsp. europaea]CAA2998535.1 pyrophosphate--fructose 6-phosphate 1-phosphotransferase subunit alpha-like [Olea europaea subsp. europaea]